MRNISILHSFPAISIRDISCYKTANHKQSESVCLRIFRFYSDFQVTIFINIELQNNKILAFSKSSHNYLNYLKLLYHLNFYLFQKFFLILMHAFMSFEESVLCCYECSIIFYCTSFPLYLNVNQELEAINQQCVYESMDKRSNSEFLVTCDY